jgi:hypothetical protein
MKDRCGTMERPENRDCTFSACYQSTGKCSTCQRWYETPTGPIIRTKISARHLLRVPVVANARSQLILIAASVGSKPVLFRPSSSKVAGSKWVVVTSPEVQ